MNSPSAVSTAVPAREKAHDATAAATASTGPRVQPARAAASTAATPATAVAYAHGGAHASGQARASNPSVTLAPLSSDPENGVFLIAKTFAPENGAKPFVIMSGTRFMAGSRRGGGRRAAG